MTDDSSGETNRQISEESITITLNNQFMRHLLALVLIFSFSTAFSQNKIDSLQQELSKKTGKERILTLNELSDAYRYVDYTRIYPLAQEALQLIKQNKEYTILARTYNIMGVFYAYSSKYDESDKYYDRCILTSKKYGSELDIYHALLNKTKLYRYGYVRDSVEALNNIKKISKLSFEKKEFYDLFVSLFTYTVVFNSTSNSEEKINNFAGEMRKMVGNDLNGNAAILVSEGNYYRSKNKLFLSIHKFEKGLKITNSDALKYECLKNIGQNYNVIRRSKESLKFFIEAANLIHNGKEKPNINKELEVELLLGACYFHLNDYQKAIIHLSKVENNVLLDPIYRLIVFNNLAESYIELNNLSKGEFYLNKSLSIANNLKFVDGIANNYSIKIDLLTKRGKFKEIPSLISKINNILVNVNDIETKKQCFETIKEFYKNTGHYKEAFDFQSKYVVVNDSINNEDYQNKFLEFQTKYETEKKEQQIVLQDTQIKSQHRFLIELSISGVLLLIAFIFIFILYNKRNQAYKKLVFQSMGKIDNEELFDDSEILGTDNELEEVTEKIANQKNNNPLFDETTRTQIKEELQKQLSSKVYLDDSITINKLATLCNTNRTYLSQVINETYQMNFNTFINKLRIDEAKKLLIDESFETPLKQLSTQLGFNTYTVFNDAFKKFIGVTPAFFLRTVKAERENEK